MGAVSPAGRTGPGAAGQAATPAARGGVLRYPQRMILDALMAAAAFALERRIRKALRAGGGGGPAPGLAGGGVPGPAGGEMSGPAGG
jgi:hypothetical protein